MSERLDELRRQRALVQEHLAWLDRQLAKETASDPTGAPPPIARPAAAPAPEASTARAPDDADALIVRLAREEDETPALSQAGCWTVFIAGLLLLVGGVVAALYFFYR